MNLATIQVPSHLGVIFDDIKIQYILDIIFLMSFYIVKGYRVFGDLSFDIRVLSGKEFYLQQISRIQVRLI